MEPSNQSTNFSALEDIRSPCNDSYWMDNPEEMLKPWKFNSNFVPIVVTHSVTFLFGVIGNVIIITTMTRDKSARNATSLFLVSLAVADLLLLVICIPLETVHYFVITWDQEGTICKLSSYGEMLSGVASVLNLTAVSLERYIVIVYPIKSRSLCTISNCRRALVSVWVLSLILAMPIIITRGTTPFTYCNNETNLTFYYCWDFNGDETNKLPFYIALYQFCITFALPCIMMIFCYSRVINELWISTKAMSEMTRVSSARFNSRSSISSALKNSAHQNSIFRYSLSQSKGSFGGSRSNSNGHNSATNLLRNSMTHPKTVLATSSEDVRQARKQVIKMLILVIALFLICWGPRLILQIMIKQELDDFTPQLYSLRIVLQLLPYVHSCLNPIIYSFMSSNFRRMMLRSCSGHRTCNPVHSCCRSSTESMRQKAVAATYELNSELRCQPSLPFGNDVRTSPITECETMIHDVMSIT